MVYFFILIFNIFKDIIISFLFCSYRVVILVEFFRSSHRDIYVPFIKPRVLHLGQRLHGFTSSSDTIPLTAQLKIYIQLLGITKSKISSRIGGQFTLAKYSMQYKLTNTPLPKLKENHMKTFPADFSRYNIVSPRPPKSSINTG